jgi:hypothetical protein
MIFGPFVDYARQPVNRLRPCSSTRSPRPPVLRVPEIPGNPSDLLAVTGRAPAGSAAADPHHSELADATLKGIKARPSSGAGCEPCPAGPASRPGLPVSKGGAQRGPRLLLKEGGGQQFSVDGPVARQGC